MSKVTLDCSKVKSFIGDDELTSMKDIAENAKKVFQKYVANFNPEDGRIRLKIEHIMTRKNSRELKRRHRRFRVIQRFLL